ncbi:tachylectin-related carbohydrate-binding protein [Actinokineospora globicatena]|uniref:tachylectin-related carbohydrate-binding protein n=1 Tax=Actinokineospora globicatena TaxID=103729 RepID=UPI0020A46886|nr:tachylectin-related carbohydrate-binding protein [Actinokineospora globicatena]MCP2303844.1 Tachylectin [Actinokineospora globicatena]
MRRRAIRWSTPFLAAVTAVPLVLLGGGQSAAADPTLTCRTGVPVFTTRTNGDLAIYQHEEPENGQVVWSQGQVRGTQWFGKTLAGPDGVVYSIPTDGSLKRFRWNGTGWDGAGVPIGQGWQRFTQAQYRNLVTVDETGRIYAVDAAGALRAYLWDNTSQTWANAAGDVVATGWGQYDLITAAGAGVIYARKPTGQLIRFRYHAESQRFVQRDKQVDTGWDGFIRVFSPGADILYGVTEDGDLLWYRYLEASDEWVGGDNQGVQVGSAWGNEVDTTAMSDACKLSPNPFPSRVTVPLDNLAPTRALLGKNGVPQYFYVDGYGRVVHGKQVGTDPRTVQLAPFAETNNTKTPAAVLGSGDRLQTFVLGQDGETRTGTESADWLSWSAPSSLGGWTPGPATFVRGSDNLVRGFAVDSAGALWSRWQAAVDGPLLPWVKLGGTNLTQDFTVVRSGTAFEILVRNSSGTLVVAKNTGTTLGTWRTVGGGTITDRPAAVVNPDGKLQVYARRADGLLHTQRETTSGFPGTWSAIAGVSVVGSPAATVHGNGGIRLAVRSTDSYVYVTAQSAPGSTTYDAWTALADGVSGSRSPSDTEPTLITVGGGQVLITFRDANEISYYYQSTPTSFARSGNGGYTGGSRR